MIKLVVYDLDGTLVDTLGDVVSAINATLVESGIAPVEAASIRGAFGHGIRELLERVLQGSSRERIEEVIAAFRLRYRQNIVQESQVYAGLEAILSQVEARGVSQAVLTNKFEAGARLLLQTLGVSRYFDPIAGPDTYDSVKPDPKGLQALLRYHQVSPDEAVMVGDSENDILAAKGAGVPVIAVGYGYQELSRLMGLGPEYRAQSVVALGAQLAALL